MFRLTKPSRVQDSCVLADDAMAEIPPRARYGPT